MMKAGKHILCEKSVASNMNEAEEMFRTAAENNVILLEAMRSVFDPGMDALKANLNKLGVIRRATVNYCQYSSRYDSFLQGQDHNIFRRSAKYQLTFTELCFIIVTQTQDMVFRLFIHC